MGAIRLSRPATERLLTLVGVRPPWRIPGATPAPSRTATRLGPPAAGTRPGNRPGTPADAAAGAGELDAELSRLGILGDDGVHPDLVAALGVLARAEVLLDLDLAVKRADGVVRFHSWQRMAGDVVVALSTTGGDVELGWHARADWARELSGVPAALPARPGEPGEPDPRCPSPHPVTPVTLPQGLLVATGAALRAGRGDLADALVDEQRLSTAEVRHLHECRARLRVVVTGPTRIRWLGWVLLGDGWRELSVAPPASGTGPAGSAAGTPGVRLTPVAPSAFGQHVEQLVRRVQP